MAKKDKGWIKVHRQIMDNPMWTSSKPFDQRSAWIDLLLMANHEERTIQLRNGNYKVIGVGQLFTSMDHLATRWHWSRNRVIRYFKQLSAQGMCTVNGTADGTTVTLVKYDNFQGGRTPKRTADGTTDGTTDGTRTRIIRTNNKHDKQEIAPEAQGRFYE